MTRHGQSMSWVFVGVIALLGGLLGGCDDRNTSASSSTSARPVSPSARSNGPTIELTFTYGSEKENWIKDVTAAFNNGDAKTKSGKRVIVTAIPMGSGESIDELLGGTRKAHLTSPASAAFVKLGNAQSRAKTGVDLLGPTENLVLSPVVIAMWKPMAEAIGWGSKPVGWADVLALARDPKGWTAHGHPEWGPFKFGHTHPEYSNSGLISVLAEVYAGAGKTAGLTLDDVNRPETAQFLSQIEQAVVHYGSSTGFFGKKMFANGPEYLSAAVLYENNVIESYGSPALPVLPVVAIYPKEGTFWCDHPVGIVQREWVTDEHKEASRLYIDFLLARPQQEKATTFGFRPADPAIALAEPFDANHGVDPKEPKTTLEVPSVEVTDAVVQLWRKNKKHASIVLVFDTSGSMKEQSRIVHARHGATELVRVLGDEDTLTLLPFNTTPQWGQRSVPMSSGRLAMTQTIEGLFPQGGTALYDAVSAAYAELRTRPDPMRISAIVVLSDGEDTDSRLKLEPLLSRIKPGAERESVRIFTIGYGSGAKKDVLKKIAETTQAKFYEGTTQNIREVFKDIATFF